MTNKHNKGEKTVVLLKKHITNTTKVLGGGQEDVRNVTKVTWIAIPTKKWAFATKTFTSLSEENLLIKLEEYIKFINLPSEFKSYIDEYDNKVRYRERYKMLLKFYNIKKEEEKETEDSYEEYISLREKNPFVAFWLDAVEYLGWREATSNKIYLPKITVIEKLIKRQKKDQKQKKTDAVKKNNDHK
jgi:hypothetical protein